MRASGGMAGSRGMDAVSMALASTTNMIITLVSGTKESSVEQVYWSTRMESRNKAILSKESSRSKSEPNDVT